MVAGGSFDIAQRGLAGVSVRCLHRRRRGAPVLVLLPSVAAFGSAMAVRCN